MSRKKTAYAFVVLLFLTFLSLTIHESSAAVTVTKHITCADVDTSTDTWKTIDCRDTFLTDDQKVVAYFEYEGANPSHKLKTVWIAPDGTNVDARVSDIQWTGVTGVRTLTLEGTELPVGFWKMEIYVDNSLISTAKFTLQPSLDLVS